MLAGDNTEPAHVPAHARLPGRFMGTGTRFDALVADLGLLYPGATISTVAPSGRAAPGARNYRLLLSRRRPRILVPTDSPSATREAVRRDTANDRVTDVLKRRAVAMLAAHPLGHRLFRDVVSVGTVGADSLETYVATCVGDSVRLSLHSGAPRANAKPVVGIHRTSGASIGFCKVGITPLAAQLVAHETTTLQLLASAGLAELLVPPVLHVGRWSGHDVLLIGALRGNRGRLGRLPVKAMREIVEAPGSAVSALRDGPWAARIGESLSGARPEFATRIRQALDTLVDQHGQQPLVHGGCHGDWGPWNMSWAGDRPLVWDWERFTVDTPAGVDSAHFTAHSRLRRIGDLTLAERAVRDAEQSVRAVIEPWSVPDAAATVARIVVVAYLIEFATRLAVEADDAGTELVGRIASWYLDVAERRLNALRGLAR